MTLPARREPAGSARGSAATTDGINGPLAVDALGRLAVPVEADRSSDTGGDAPRSGLSPAVTPGGSSGASSGEGTGDAADSSVPPGRTPRAGRDLPAAIAVGVGLGGLIIVSLFVVQALFVAVASAALLVALWELRGALANRGISLPVVPIAIAVVGTVVSAYVGGLRAVAVAAAFGVLLVMVWRMFLGERGYVRDTAAGVFVTGYLGVLGAFAPLMLAEPRGPQRVTLFILLTVCNDTGGYIVGVLAGRHPMAPRISPKKSWEGLAGSVLCAAVGGALGMTLMLHGQWWQGVVLGVAVVASATTGDLIESMIKRDLGIKDMGSLLPGHGGIMDRLDSLLPTAILGWALLAAFLGV